MTRVVCAQLAPVIGDLSANAGTSTAAVEAAAADGADLIVLPELVTSGYVFSSAAEARSLAIPPGSPLLADWGRAAGNATVVGGFCEAGDDGRVYNSAAVVDRSGVLAVYRKTHLWDAEGTAFSPGTAAPPVVETAAGRVGVLICYDMEFPEMTRGLALAGADVLAVPTNWPLMPRPDGERPGEVVTAMAAARANRVYLACCDRTGVERGQSWTEGTSIVDPDGWVLATAGPGVASIAVDVDLGAARRKTISDVNDVLADRRTDVYRQF
ncbi:nitrilase-related carbon-nitrogen hydrolase [Cryptosporangium phraense]|uniref:Hydrolase n=1 Tax=Cryptosporangium phraense TaxID=2593070 RepID=A0A545AVE3_9ACTN|nr:nitrilase-related carbon-nitrogen hydrolase [Cryptosporangium phraense]TQS45296.1 hydrolase [Cryptosporangium phraense]